MELKKLAYSHKAMADLILAHPGIHQNHLAAMFGYTPGWISQVLNSDGFQAYLATRQNELVDPMLTATIEERLRGLAAESIRVLQEKLAMEPKADIAIKALEASTRALGFGAKAAGAEVNVQFVVALPPKAASNEEWLASRPAIEARGTTIEAERG